MVKNRIVYIIWLLAVGTLHIFGNQYGTRVILYASVLIPAAMVFIAWYASRHMKFRLDLPETCRQDEKVNISIQTGITWLPINTKCHLLWENLLTGETWEETTEKREFYIQPKHCGTLKATMEHSKIFDIFGLLGWKTKSQPKALIIVMPNQIATALKTNLEALPTLDSEEYSMSHQGSDPSETFAIREYAPGDPLKSIHWKLSNKTDKLLVRELGLPITQNILVLVETSIPEEASPHHISKMAENAYSICHALLEDDINHSLGWLDTMSLEYKNQEITNTTELDEAFAQLLTNTAKPCPITATQTHDKYKYSQIFLVKAGDKL